MFRKATCDSFKETPLEDTLRSRNIDMLLLAGYATEQCVDTTLRSAASKDYKVVVVSDAHTTKDRPVLKAEQIVAHHHWLWPSLMFKHRVALVAAEKIEFH